MAAGKPKVIIIGAGKIAFSITAALIEAGYEVASIISRKKMSAGTLALQFNISHYSNDPKTISVKSGLFIIAVPDDQIHSAAEALSGLNLDFDKSYFVHVSGVENSDSLEALARKGGNTASFHIMQTFPSKKVVNLKGCAASVETKNLNTKNFLFRLAKQILLKPVAVTPEEKVLYHISGVFASNFMVGNFYAGSMVMPVHEKKNKTDHLKSISIATLNNILSSDIPNALSGPVERGDYGTILRHINSLDRLLKGSGKKENMHLIKLSYIVQSLFLLHTAERKKGRLSSEHSKIKNHLTKLLKESTFLK